MISSMVQKIKWAKESWSCTIEMYRESLEAMFEAWLLSDNLPESVFARDAIYCNYKMLMKFLEQSL